MSPKQPPTTTFVAPMAGVTERPHRVLMRELGWEVVTTELISSESFHHGSKRTREMLEVCAEESPCIVQIFGSRPDRMAEIARRAERNGAIGVDINFGCPVPKVTSCGGGSGALKDLDSMRAMVQEVRDAISISLSIKIRTGWDSENIVATEVSHLAHECGVDWMSIHGRTRDQGYRGNNNWELIESVAAQAPLPIVGNGDIRSPEELRRKQLKSACSGWMMGRAILVNPTFAMSLNGEKNLPTLHELLLRFHDLQARYSHQKVQSIKFKKFAVWLSHGIGNSAHFRRQLLRSGSSIGEALGEALKFFPLEQRCRNPSDLSFLKGGHG